MKVVIFGAGKFYEKRREQLFSFSDIELVAVIDNNQDIEGTHVDGVPVLKVTQIVRIDFDIIILMSVKTNEMKKQLLSLGIDDKRIWYWKRFESEKNKGRFCFYCGNPMNILTQKKVLIISTDLGYNGGSLAAFYAAKALKECGYNVVLAAPGGNPAFIKEIVNSEVNVVICSALPYLYEEEIFFVNQFDFIIVNVFQMILCASELSKIKPVVWWIHESSVFYDPILELFSDYAREEMLEKVNIYAVSRIAQNSFNRYFSGRITKTLAYGIPDEREIIAKDSENNKIIFAVIGGVIPLKAQDIFLQAVKKIPEELRRKALFWIIGLIGQDSYSNLIRDMVAQEPSVVLFGEMTRMEIQKVYNEIDVLVCPSLEDSLPIVVTEGMMYGKACIVSDSVGTVQFIKEKENGFICETGNPEHLAEKMRWVIEHKDTLPVIGEKAREVYERHFTIDKFATRLESAILSAGKSYPAKTEKNRKRE